jgi:predicted permease
MFGELRSWMRNMVRRTPVDDLLDREVRSCVEIITANKMREGLDAAEARRQALIEIGGVELVKDQVRDTRPGAGLETVVRDLRYAARLMRRQPLTTCAVVLTLSIGIGGVAAVFSLLNRFVFRTPISRNPNAYFRVVRENGGGHGTASVAEYLAWRTGARSASDLAAWSTLPLRAPLGMDPAEVPGLLVTCNVFGVLGVDTPVAGRLLNERDCASKVPVAVISEHLWRSRLGSDPAVIGAVLRYGPVAITVIGVAAVPGIQREAHDPDPDFVAGLLFPYSAQSALKDTLTLFEGRDYWSAQHAHKPWLEVAGLLRPDSSRESATTEFRLIETRQGAGTPPADRVVLTDGSRWASTPDKMLTALLMALTLPALVMLVACMNAAALLLSRTVGRHREMAIRLALGTSRADLVRMLIVESLLLSALAVVGSLVFVYTLPPVIARFLDAEPVFGPPDSLRPDWRVFVCLAFSGVLAALVAGLSPALESRNPRLTESLQGRPIYGAVRSVSRRRRVFVAIQIAASMVLLVTAMTFSRTATRVMDPGFRTEGLLVADIREQRGRAMSMSSLAASVAATPGVDSVAYAETLPLVFEGAIRVRVPDESTVAVPVAASVSATYFNVFGIPVLAGPGFQAAESVATDGLTPVVISRRLAHRFFGRENAVGRIIETTESPARRLVVVGIAADRPTGRASMSAALNEGSMIYEVMSPASSSGFLVMTIRGDVENAAERLRTELRDLTGWSTSVRTFDSILAERLAPVRRIQTLLAAMGIVALTLAVIGVVGGMFSHVTHREKELAIRLALGASPRALRWQVVMAGLTPVRTGVSVGVLASWGMLKLAESQRILPLGSIAGDASPYIAIAVVLVAVALATLLVLSSHVGRRDPVATLRVE